MDGSGEQYFSPSPSVRSSRRSVPLALPDLTIELATDRGVFSYERIDPGTKLLLLDGARPSAGPANYLDLGCGYGPIALTLALRATASTVWAVDVNERARALCRENADASGVGERVEVCAPGNVPVDVRFDGIWSNPPIRIGKPALHALLADWFGRLSEGAAANLVAHKHLGADSLAGWLRAGGFAVDRVGSRMGYRLLTVHPPGDQPAIATRQP